MSSFPRKLVAISTALTPIRVEGKRKEPFLGGTIVLWELGQLTPQPSRLKNVSQNRLYGFV